MLNEDDKQYILKFYQTRKALVWSLVLLFLIVPFIFLFMTMLLDLVFNYEDSIMYSLIGFVVVEAIYLIWCIRVQFKLRSLTDTPRLDNLSKQFPPNLKVKEILLRNKVDIKFDRNYRLIIILPVLIFALGFIPLYIIGYKNMQDSIYLAGQTMEKIEATFEASDLEYRCHSVSEYDGSGYLARLFLNDDCHVWLTVDNDGKISEIQYEYDFKDNNDQETRLDEVEAGFGQLYDVIKDLDSKCDKTYQWNDEFISEYQKGEKTVHVDDGDTSFGYYYFAEDDQIFDITNE